MPGQQPQSLMHHIGAFFGHVAKAIRTDVAPTPQRTEVRRESHTATTQTPGGPVTLRRTVIEEVELPSPPAATQPNQPSKDNQ